MGTRDYTTPVPNDTLIDLSSAVIRIESKVTSIQEKQLPPVASAAQQARDGVITLSEKAKNTSERIRILENAPRHVCNKSSTVSTVAGEIADHRASISVQERELAGLSKWRWWLMGLIVSIVLGLTTWAISSATKIAQIEAESRSTKRSIERHEALFKSLEARREADRDSIIREVRAVPRTVEKKLPRYSLEDAIEIRGLTSQEKRLVKEIMRRVEVRRDR